MPYQLRPYQLEFVARCRSAYMAGDRRILGVAPTGAGKTVMGCHIVEECTAKGNRILWLAHRKELIEQCSKKLDENGLHHGVIKSGHWRYLPHLAVQVASIQTLVRRGDMPPADVVVTDEAHHVGAKSYQHILAHYPNALHLGLTATPYRTDGRGLGEFYETLIEVTDIPTLIAEGFLVEPAVYAPANPDLAGIKRIAGDFNRRQLGEAMDKPKLVGDLVQTWLRLARGRTTVAFAVSVEHSRHIVESFEQAGIAAAHLDATMPDEEREDVLQRLASGRLQLVSNMGILTEGWDLPQTGCVLLARPTQSKGLYFQMVGRGLRSCPGKLDCIVLDHAGNTIRHGQVTEAQTYSLDGVKKREKDEAPSVRVCPQCFTALPGGIRMCTRCNYYFPIVARDRLPQSVTGELTRVEHRPYLPEASTDQRQRRYIDLIQTCRTRGYQRNWADVRFKVLFGSWPSPDIKALAEAHLDQNGHEL